MGVAARTARYQAVWLSAGWDTQVFIPAREGPQLEDMAYFMARFSSGFNPDDGAALASENVLAGLNRGVNLASSEQMRIMLTGKFENPWLGILALHAMRLDQGTDQYLVDIVRTNVGSLLYGHPDLRALDLTPEVTAPQPFTFPPVLYASLKLVREHASQFPGTVEPHTLASRPLQFATYKFTLGILAHTTTFEDASLNPSRVLAPFPSHLGPNGSSHVMRSVTRLVQRWLFLTCSTTLTCLRIIPWSPICFGFLKPIALTTLLARCCIPWIPSLC